MVIRGNRKRRWEKWLEGGIFVVMAENGNEIYTHCKSVKLYSQKIYYCKPIKLVNP